MTIGEYGGRAMHKAAVIFAAVLCAGVLFAPAARAQDCTLKQLASLDLVRLSSGLLAVPVTIAGTEQKFAIAISSPQSSVAGSYADSLKLDPDTFWNHGTITYWGQRIYQSVRMPNILIGHAVIPAPEVFRVNNYHEQGLVGVIGLDILSQMDVELDLKNNKLNLFRQDHCKGQVVYWGAPYVTLPIKLDRMGAITYTMNLDGHEASTAFDMTLSHGWMDMLAANKLLNISSATPELKLLSSDRNIRRYSYPFKSLSVEGITISNPHIDIVDKGTLMLCNGHARFTVYNIAMTCYGGSDVTIGLEELRAMHMYFAFGEKTLYVTAADAQK